MDLTIPSHKLKTFTASLTTLGKIGKDLYWSFDPLEGLTLSTLNDAKSAFCRFHFECGFFERCALLSGFRIAGDNEERDRARAAAPSRRDEDGVDGNSSEEERNDDDDDDGEFETRYTCRVPLRAVHSIMRPSRKNVLSLRIRSEGRDAETGEYFGWTDGGRSAATERGSSGSPSAGNRRDGRRGRKRKNRHHQQKQQQEEEEEDEEGKEWRKMSYSERRRRSRSRVDRGNNYHETENDSDSDEEGNRERNNRNKSHKNINAKNARNNFPSNREEDKMMLTFEFFIESPTRFKHTHNKNNNSQTNNPNTLNSTTVFRSLHKVAVTTTHGISLSDKYSKSNSTYSSRSQIISHPKQWIRLLDPLQRTAQEVALRIDDALGVVTASSFHSGEYSAAGAGGEGGASGTRGENVLLLAAAARKAFLKTETSMNCQEFEEYDFRSYRGKRRRTRRRREKRGGKMASDGGNDRSGKRANGSEGDTSSDEECDDEDNEDDGGEFDFEREDDRPPPDVNEKVILVFSMKEAKAMFQFCSQASNYSNAYDDDSLSVVSFHWGGRPLMIETDGDFYNAELVLSTLHYGMIASTVNVGGGGSDDRGN